MRHECEMFELDKQIQARVVLVHDSLRWILAITVSHYLCTVGSLPAISTGFLFSAISAVGVTPGAS